MGSEMSRRALLTGAFRKETEAPSEPADRGRKDTGAPPSAEQREALDHVLEQMNGPTGFEDLEVRKP